jgi:hypothetical protein
MTTEEVFRAYIDIYRVLVKGAGLTENNPVYKNIDQLLEDNKEQIEKAIRDEVEFKLFLTVLQYPVLEKVHGIEKLKDMEPGKIHDLLLAFYDLYLKDATKKFCKKYGLAPFEDPEMTFIVHQIKKRKE